MSAIPSIIGALSSTGLAAYQVSQGAPVSVSNVAGIPSYSVGSPFTGTSGTIIIIVALIAVAYFAFK
jgi:hypothetical protein